LRQLVTESLVLASVACAFGLFLAWIGVRTIHTFALTDIPRMETASLDLRVLGATLAISLMCGVLSGLWPAFKASQVRPGDTLKTGGLITTDSARSHLRDLLAISEIAAAIVLLVAAGLIVRSFVHLSRSDWGFNPDRLLLIDVKVPPEMKRQPEPANEWAESVVATLKALDGVEHASRSDGVPVRWSIWRPTTVGVNGRRAGDGGTWVVGRGYFTTAGIPILDGREFGGEDSALAASRVVVSQALARKLWPRERAVGKQLQLLDLKRVNGKPLPEILERVKRRDPTLASDPNVLEPIEGRQWEVIGVVADVRMFGLDLTPDPALYLDYRQCPRTWNLAGSISTKLLVRTTNKPTDVAERAKAAIVAVNPRATFTEIAPMADLVSKSIGGRGSNKLMILVSTVFGTLALTFAIIGIYGVVSHSVSQRLREIGIRVALGASQGDVVHVVIGYTARLLTFGLALGLTAAWAVTRGLQSQLAGVTATDAPTYAGAVVVLALPVLAACLLPLRRALRFDPVALFKA
jgi:predicted permease